MAQHKVSFLENNYKNQNGESARGVTVILDGKFGEVIEQLKAGNPNYTNNIAKLSEEESRGWTSALGLRPRPLGAQGQARH